MSYTIKFKEGKNLGTFRLKGEVIEAFIKPKGRNKVFKGVKYNDEKYIIHSALMLAMEKINRAFSGENLTIEMEQWMDSEIAKRVIEAILNNIVILNLVTKRGIEKQDFNYIKGDK